MRAIRLPGNRHAALVDRPEPSARDDIVKVRLTVVPMCTESRNYAAGDQAERLGHEAAGIVVDAGRSTRVAVGDRVVVMPQYGCGRCSLCTSGEHIYCSNQRDVLAETGSGFGTATFAEYLIKPDWLLLRVPDDITLLHAAMACCALGPAFNAMHTMNVSLRDTVLVVGCGPVGLGAVVNAVARGARVVAVDVNAYRLKLAERLGATAVFDASDDATVSNIHSVVPGGVTATFDSTGLPSAIKLIEEVVRPRGRISFVVLGTPLELRRLVSRGLDVHGCWHWNHLRDSDEMFEVIRHSTSALDLLVTHRFPLEAVEDAFELQLTGACGKVVLLPFGDES